MIIQEMMCEDCKHWSIESCFTGRCKKLGCFEPYNRPASNCSSFECRHKGTYCSMCINKEVCK